MKKKMPTRKRRFDPHPLFALRRVGRSVPQLLNPLVDRSNEIGVTLLVAWVAALTSRLFVRMLVLMLLCIVFRVLF